MATTSLDSQSRRSVQEFLVQFCIGCAVVLGPCALGLRPLVGAGQLLVVMFSTLGFADFFLAMIRRQKMNGVSLNLFDEAIAFMGCSYLLHAIIRYQS